MFTETDEILSTCACDPKIITVRDATNPTCTYPNHDTVSKSPDHFACKIWKHTYDNASTMQKEKNTQHCICVPDK